jgi:hypothetical protein
MQPGLDRPPGVRFEIARPQREPNVLRSDIAGFAGPTERGPVGELVRVSGWRKYLEIFGELTELPHSTAFAIKGYFDNGGDVAYVVRTIGDTYQTAWTAWDIGDLDPAVTGFDLSGTAFRIEASSPGDWANGLKVSIVYRRLGRRNVPELDVEIYRPGIGMQEFLRGLSPKTIVDDINTRSQFIRLAVTSTAAPATISSPGPLSRRWAPGAANALASLSHGSEAQPKVDDYEAAIELLLGAPEVALLAVPDLHVMDGSATETGYLQARTAARATLVLDRQLVATLPPNLAGFNQTRDWVDGWKLTLPETARRSIATYHPWIDVEDPLGGAIAPLRRISPVGHIAGAISRLDRERGAHHTPANTTLIEVADVAESWNDFEQASLTTAGINVLRCQSGSGVVIWGGRTLADPNVDREGLYIAHRRLVQRLVRAIRRVAAPLVFENNGPELWLTIVRGITAVLLASFRAGALKGERPEQGFRVTCDETNNPTESIDTGRVVCEIKIAPAVPMEFITLRIAMSADGRLELIEP